MFEELKYRLTTSPILAYQKFEYPKLATDYSDVGLGAVLFQEYEGREHVIAYASRTLNRPEKNYSVTESGFGVGMGYESFSTLLVCKAVPVDHRSLSSHMARNYQGFQRKDSPMDYNSRGA